MSDYIVPSVAEIKAAAAINKPKFEAVSLFAGGGGSSTGYRMAGGKVLAINEFIPEAINTYRANWPDTTILPGDVRKLTPEQILAEIGKAKGELDLLDGSPPCSAFSTAGAREKGWGKTKKYSDSEQKNVEDLFFEYIRILRGTMPKVFVAENVSGLAKGTAKGYLNEILRELRTSGYQVSCKILDAKWLGVPQSRARAIFVGVREDIWRPEFHDKLHPTPKNSIVNLTDAFKGLTFSETDKAETDIKKYSVYKLLQDVPMGGAHPKRFSLKKAHPQSYSQCITATNGSIGAANACHWDNRAFTVSEVKRIMSVPDDYVLTGKYQQQVERLGRMVAPLMMKAVAENICNLGVFNADTK
jgi:DNA (cytosine-5)-methyltransferase 1